MMKHFSSAIRMGGVFGSMQRAYEVSDHDRVHYKDRSIALLSIVIVHFVKGYKRKKWHYERKMDVYVGPDISWVRCVCV